jgi:sulfur carrier protein ThiS
MDVVIARLPRPNVPQRVQIPAGATVLDALRRLGTPPDAVVVLREGTPIPLDATLHEGDDLRVFNVFSGG